MSLSYVITNYSLGWTVIRHSSMCESWLLLPGEDLWLGWIRGLLYFMAMIYMFLGIAIACDVFVCSIERIISTTVSVTKIDPITGAKTTVEEYFWNETVANLTLMALGSSAPEILLATMESIFKLPNIDNNIKVESLGLFTICGSAAFNLFVITGICIMSVPSPNVKLIKGRIIFIMNSLWSIWAYVWLLLVTVIISPREIEPWEAWLTIIFFPTMVISVYCQNRKWWYHKWWKASKIADSSIGKLQNSNTEEGNIGLNNIRKSMVSIASSVISKTVEEDGSELTKKNEVKKIGLKPRFTHQKFTQAMGVYIETKKRKPIEETKAISQISLRSLTDKSVLGKFAFKSAAHSILESEGKVTVAVLFYRIYPLPNILKDVDRIADGIPEGINLTIKGVAEVDFETSDGSAKVGSDYEYASGTVVFEENECCKTITVQIVDDPDYEENKDFYIILKKPKGSGIGIAEQSITRVTIIDDDDPGEFSFDKECYHPNEDGVINVIILRKNGNDGTAKMQVTSSNKTATGGSNLAKGIDYVTVEESIIFKHEEMFKTIVIETNIKSNRKKIFNISLEILSDGCRYGEIRAAKCLVGIHNEDSEDESEEDDASWPDQFRNAMTLDRQFDENGEEIQGGFLVYFLHFCSFFWRFICAFIPPRKYLGAYPAFFGSLVILGTMTTIVEQLGNLLGCVIGIKTEVTGITIVAIGTSLQDTFASRAAALQDETADNSIGHITGSNAVNVFLGLGVPWVISSMYAYTRGKPYCVTPTDIFQSILVFLILACVAICILVFRRLVFKGELGGPIGTKITFGFIFISMWVIYLIILSLKTYNIIIWNFKVADGRCS